MYSVLNTLSEYTYFYKSKNVTSYTFLLVFKIVESLRCILNWKQSSKFFSFYFLTIHYESTGKKASTNEIKTQK